MDQPAEYDSPWKDVLRTFFPAFLELLFPHVYQDVDWSKGVEFLDTELQQVVRDAELGRRYADKLAKVYRKGGQEAWVLLHVEVQGQPEKGLPERIYIYNYRLFDYNGRRVVSLVVLADSSPSWRPDRYEDELWGCSITLRFPTVKLLDYAGRTEELERSTNPAAVVVLAHLQALATAKNGDARLESKWRLVRGLYERGFSRENVLELFRFIEWVMALPPALQDRFQTLVQEYEKEHEMPYVTEIERSAIARGRQEGVLGEAREAVMDIVGVRLGAVPHHIRRWIEEMEDMDALRALRRRAVTISSLDELEKDLPPAQPS